MIRKAWLLPVFLLGLTLVPEASAQVSVGLGVRGFAGGFSVGRVPPVPRGYVYGPVGRAPGVGFAWQNGFWDVRGRGYHWVPGQWVRAPRANAYWVAPAWQRHRNSYAWRPGYWR